jgi:hypothetical protein
MAMKIGGEYQLQLIQSRHWQKLANQIGFKESFVFQQINKMAGDITKELPYLMAIMPKSSILDESKANPKILVTPISLRFLTA